MSRHDRAGGRPSPPCRNGYNGNSDDNVPHHLLPPRFCTDREFRRRITNAINMELRDYQGHYHLDDSFYNYMDTRGRGSRVRDEGNDRPTPPEMMRVLTSLIGRRILSGQEARAVMHCFCDAITDEHPFFVRYGLGGGESGPPPYSERDPRSGRCGHHHRGHREHGRSHRSAQPHPDYPLTRTPEDGNSSGSDETTLSEWASGHPHDRSHRSGGRHHHHSSRYPSRHHGGRDESDSGSEIDSSVDSRRRR